jgi:hypothetical protein
MNRYSGELTEAETNWKFIMNREAESLGKRKKRKNNYFFKKKRFRKNGQGTRAGLYRLVGLIS